MSNNNLFDLVEKNELLENIEKYKEEYYSQKKKNNLFKNTQKVELAKHICSQNEIINLMGKTIYSSCYSNQVFIDYHMFKLYANPDNFEMIKNYAVTVFQKVRFIFNEIEIHIDLKGFTVSAAERYRKFIQLICADCLNKNDDFINKIYIYNPPNIIQNFFGLFGSLFTQSMRDKVIIVPSSKN